MRWRLQIWFFSGIFPFIHCLFLLISVRKPSVLRSPCQSHQISSLKPLWFVVAQSSARGIGLVHSYGNFGCGCQQQITAPSLVTTTLSSRYGCFTFLAVTGKEVQKDLTENLVTGTRPDIGNISCRSESSN